MSDQTTNGVNVDVSPAETPVGSNSPIGLLLRLFSSIWLGVTLLILLFIYSSIGSAGMPVSWRLLEPATWVNVRELVEMSEFAWFHWWPFDVMIALICVNLVVATIRRIPFNRINLGVWMIHTGIIILAIGSVWYFWTKVEGDVVVPRRTVVINVPGEEPVRLVASPGQRTSIGKYDVGIFQTTPDWELLSGDDAGKRAYKVSVTVQGPQQVFIRELIDGYPQYTEDLVRGEDPNQPFARAKNTLGRAIVDEGIDLALDMAPQDRMYLRETRSLYIREMGEAQWHERPIDGMPMFNDRLASPEHVWPQNAPYGLDPVDLRIGPSGDDDPFPEVEFVVTDYLRYASLETRQVPDEELLDPVADLVVRDVASGAVERFELAAFDRERAFAENGAIEFRWVRTAEELERLRNAPPPTLTINIPATGDELVVPVAATLRMDPTLDFTPIGSSEYAYRVLSFENGLDIGSLARVEIRKGDAEPFTRWVFDDPSLTQEAPPSMDTAIEDVPPLDAGIEMTYSPGSRDRVLLTAGPTEDQLNLFVPSVAGGDYAHVMEPGVATRVRSGIDFTVENYLSRTRRETRPRVVPFEQRRNEVGMMLSMARVTVPDAVGEPSAWLTYHHYPFATERDVVRRFAFVPRAFRLADGRVVEALLSRQSYALPEPVVLDTFEVDSHVGGFTGETSSVLDWRSLVRFETEPGPLSDRVQVNVNNPAEYAGLWYFQSAWDPPDGPRFEGDPGSTGLNYTVLGVANRNGVNVQLVGCCISVIGMMYAFYVKPWLKRRRQQAVYAEVDKARKAKAAPVLEEVAS